MLVCGSPRLSGDTLQSARGRSWNRVTKCQGWRFAQGCARSSFFLMRDKDVAQNTDARMLKNISSTIRRKPIALKPENGIRRYDRTGFDHPIFVQDEQGWEIPLDAMDLSASGMFVKSSALFEVGEMHTLHFEHADGSPLRVDAKVVRVCSPSASLVDDAGMGYEFQDIDERTYDALCECVVNL